MLARYLVLQHELRLHLSDGTCSQFGMHPRRGLHLPLGRDLRVRERIVDVHGRWRLPRDYARDRGALHGLDRPVVRFSELKSRFAHYVFLHGQLRRERAFDLDVRPIRCLPRNAASLQPDQHLPGRCDLQLRFHSLHLPAVRRSLDLRPRRLFPESHHRADPRRGMTRRGLLQRA